VILKIVPEASSKCILEKLTNESEGKPAQKSDAASQQLLESISVFKKASRNFIFIFLLNKAG
jgi:hypothetical protein